MEQQLSKPNFRSIRGGATSTVRKVVKHSQIRTYVKFNRSRRKSLPRNGFKSWSIFCSPPHRQFGLFSPQGNRSISAPQARRFGVGHHCWPEAAESAAEF